MWGIFLIFAHLIVIGESQSCSNFFQYVQGIAGVEGSITYNPPRALEHNLQVVLSVTAHLPSTYVGDLTLYKSVSAAIEDLRLGLPLVYRVLFPISYPLPKVVEISHNGYRICTDQGEYSTYYTTITLRHKLMTNGASNNIVNNVIGFLNPFQNFRSEATQPPVQVPSTYYYTQPIVYVETTQRTFTYRPESVPPPQPPHISLPVRFQQNFIKNSNNFNAAEIQCGTRANAGELMVTALIIGGKKAGRRDFPWLVAQLNRQKQFTCGGSLVSSRIITSAAHCFQEKGMREKINVQDATYYLGKYDITKLTEDGYVSSEVERIETHPNWNPQDNRYDSDIGIAVLTKSIKFTSTIRPICLWTGSKGFSDMIGKRGLVAGWGINESGSTSDFPMFLSIPVVSDAECLRSSYNLARVTTNTSFCVGDKLARAPCSGDSGGGFIMRHGSQFYLRGIVSIGLFNADGECSPTDYVSFTDVSLFTNWIYSYINVYA